MPAFHSDSPCALSATVLALLIGCAESRAAIVYSNDFATSATLSDFTQSAITYQNVSTPLHQVTVENGQARIDTQSVRIGQGVASGNVHLLLDTTGRSPAFNPVLSQNGALVTWGFNVANRDGAFNNGFDFILGSTSSDIYNIATHGYVFTGGWSVGNRMAIRRFDFGMGGGDELFIDVTNGLGPLPSMGSFRITYEPASSRWSLYGQIGTSFVDPLSVGNLLGTAIDSRYTSVATPIIGFGGMTTGTDFFDNVSLSVVPEPGGLLWAGGLGAACLMHRNRRRR